MNKRIRKKVMKRAINKLNSGERITAKEEAVLKSEFCKAYRIISEAINHLYKTVSTMIQEVESKKNKLIDFKQKVIE